MSLPPLPESIPSHAEGATSDSAIETGIYNEQQMLSYAAAVRAATIEDCAKVCDEQYPYSVNHTDQRAAKNCAAAVRSLK